MIVCHNVDRPSMSTVPVCRLFHYVDCAIYYPLVKALQIFYFLRIIDDARNFDNYCTTIFMYSSANDQQCRAFGSMIHNASSSPCNDEKK
uniref:Uncharacterized protein n=1 Tax=Romanomermis culicivorax TaxID=13658 RepID=A0A915IDY9_ROMCU